MKKIDESFNKLLEKQKEFPNEKMDIPTFNSITQKLGYKQTALLWFKLNIGDIVTSEELAQLYGTKSTPISHNIRRIFELRDEEGYNIINHKDNEKTGKNLKVDEWILLSMDPDPEKVRMRGVNKRIRFEVLERDNYTCQTCGLQLGDDDPFRPGHKISLHIGHIKAHKRKEGTPLTKTLDSDDFITMCNVCNEGAKNNDIKIITLLDRVKKASFDDKKKIYEYLKSEFN